jgi:3-hydroxy acid dehydrogenase/malonic semialdehyde reductase
LKKIIITGASSGFGFETAKVFAEHGWSVFALARRTDRLQTLADTNSNISFETLDVSHRDSCQQVLEAYCKNHGAPDLLVNNAGFALGLDKASEANLDDWDSMIDVNIRGLATVTRLVLPFMVKENKGLIVNIGSIAGNWPYPGGNVYGATKAFVHHFSRNLKAELLGTNVRVTSLEPGLAETEFSNTRFKGDGLKASEVYKGTKPITPNDIASTILWLSSLPDHLNVNSLEIMATCQAWGSYAIHREAI